ncbi:MAG: sugar phosphate isomerase/epimerase [Firmicutes bacterium]|nr:sugar phosphate isomerase/epimerase [Bacillota bacterium]
MKIGAQLYTVHDFTKTLDGLAESLKKVADIGYTTVQVSGTCEYDPEWLAEELKKNGLTCTITHTPFAKMTENVEKVIRDHDVFGCDYIGIGGFFGGVDGMPDFVKNATPIAEKMKAAGKMFMYHNHNWEYESKCADGRTVMENLSDAFPAGLVGFTLDVYWAKFGGYDPLDEIKRLSGRLPCVHLKDMLLDGGEKKMSWVGGGNVMDFEKICQAFIDAGSKYAFVEQDNCNGEDPFDCLKKSFDYLRSIGLN